MNYWKLTCLLLLSLFFSMKASAFSDVKKDDYFYAAVNWGQQQQIISGYPDNTFKPYQQVTHQQFIKMYTNTFNFEKQSPKTFADYYATLKHYQMDFPKSVYTKPIARGEVAILLAFANEAIDKPNEFSQKYYQSLYEQAAHYLLRTGISTGQQTAKTAYAKIGGQNNLTRGQAITFLYRLAMLEQTTLPINIQAFYAPPLFTEAHKALRTYTMNPQITYYVLDEGVNFHAVATYNGRIMTEYFMKKGTHLRDYVIGKMEVPTTIDWTLERAYSLEPHIDSYNGDTIFAITKMYTHPQYEKALTDALQLTTATNFDHVTALYADVVNAFRSQFGRTPLLPHPTLTQAAFLHSQDMALRNYVEHVTPEGLTPTQRVENITPSIFLGVGENIVAGYNHLFSAHNALINSPNHRTNMLHPFYTHIGFGAYKNASSNMELYYTSNFGIKSE